MRAGEKVLRAASCVLRSGTRARRFFQHAARSTQHFVLLAVTLLLSRPAFACAVCFGAPGDPMVKGVNNGIWVLLGLVGFVQLGFIALFWSFWRRARAQRRFRESFHVIEGGPLS